MQAAAGKQNLGTSVFHNAFQQAYDLGAPVIAWVTKLQQAWHSIQLVFTPGEVPQERINTLAAAARYDRIRVDLEITAMTPSA